MKGKVIASVESSGNSDHEKARDDDITEVSRENNLTILSFNSKYFDSKEKIHFTDIFIQV